MDDMYFYTPAISLAYDSSDWTAEDLDELIVKKGLTIAADYYVGDRPKVAYFENVSETEHTDDLRNNLSGIMRFTVLYAPLNRG